MSNFKVFQDKFRFAVVDEKKPIVWLDTFDYGYIADEVRKLPGDVWEWRSSEGNVYDLKKGKQQPLNNKGEQKYLKLSDVLNLFPEINNISILLAQIYEGTFKQDICLLPALKEFIYKGSFKTIIIVSNQIEIPGLEHICERFTLPLPDIEDIDETLGFISTNTIVRDKNRRVTDVGEQKWVKEVVNLDNDGYYIMNDSTKGLVLRDSQMRIVDMVYNDCEKLKYPFDPGDFGENDVLFKKYYQELVDSLCGMHLYDIKELLESLKIRGEHNEIQYEYEKEGKLLDIISARKTEIIKNSGLLEIIDYKDDYYNQVADIDKIKEYIENVKKRIDTPNNYPPNLSKPKGILLVGAPGCGKSESAKAIASMLKKPLYRLNIGKLLGHKYGQSENRFIEALHTADASAPCVLWIDEIEKAFAGAGNESENDDTLTHIVGHFLTWMQDHPTMVYLVATANDLSKMKPEMLRKGRWDETFYLNYPSDTGCESIIKVISEKKFEIKLNESHEGNIAALADVMSKMPMSGSEIENILIETIQFNSVYNAEKWCIYDGDIAYILLKSLKYKKISEELLSSANEEDLKKMNFDDRFALLKKFTEKSTSNTCKKDPFLEKKVDNEFRELNIKNLGRISPTDEENVRKLLEEKYRGQYNFTPASNSIKYD